MKSLIGYLTVVAALLLFVVPASAAIPYFYVVQTGVSSFDVRVDNLSETGGIDFTIRYDPASYTNPQAGWIGPARSGTGQVNTNFAPGVIRMVVMSTSPFAGPNGSSVAHLEFTPKIAGGGPKPTLQVAIYSPSAERKAATTTEPSPGDTTAEVALTDTSGTSTGTGSSGSSGTSTSGTSGSYGTSTGTGTTATGSGTTTVARGSSGQTTYNTGAPAYLGTVTFSDSPGLKPETAAAEGQKQAAPPAPEYSYNAGSSTPSGGSEPTPAAEPPKAEYKPPKAPDRFVSNKSVLQKFKEFKGELTAKTAIELFQSPFPAGFSQKPAIVLADGTTQATLTIPAKAEDKEPQFALKGGSQLALKKTSQGWVMEVKLKKNVTDAAVTVISGPTITEYPLVAAPRIDLKGQKLTEADLDAFLKDRGTPRQPRFDLNLDGKRNYIDDYIYTANYLSVTQPKTPSPEKKDAGKGATTGAAAATKDNPAETAAKDGTDADKTKEKKGRKSKPKKQ